MFHFFVNQVIDAIEEDDDRSTNVQMPHRDQYGPAVDQEMREQVAK